MTASWRERTADWLRQAADAVELGKTGIATPQTRLWKELKFFVNVPYDPERAADMSLIPVALIAAADLLLETTAGGDLANLMLAAAKESKGEMFGVRIVKKLGSEGLPAETARAVDIFLAKAALASVQALRSERRRRA